METNKRMSVMMYPWLGYGHICPYFELAKKLAKRNFSIYLCSTPANFTSIKKNFDENLLFSIELVELHLPTLPELPPHYHTTNGLPPHLMTTLKMAFEMASSNFSIILKTLKPELLIYDAFQPWAPDAAFKLGIPAVLLITSSATLNSMMLHDVKNQGTEFPFSTIYFRPYEQVRITRLKERTLNPEKGINNFLDCRYKSSKIILVRSFKEIEGKYIDYFSSLTGKNCVPIGPIVRDPENENNYDDDKFNIKEWLDNKEKSSTVFVSFGSECFLGKEDMEEIAHGLELSGVNFIWVVRFPKGEKMEIQDALPQGFQERVETRGLVVEGWAPQAKILVNSSIGGFVSHCGWNSVIESMKFGVPIIAMPVHHDQPINARLVEEIGVGVEVVRDQGGRLQRETVAAVIKQVVFEEDGEAVREKARKMSEIINLKGEEEIDEVVEEFVQLCEEAIPLQN